MSKQKPNPFETNIGKVNPMLANDEAFKKISNTIETDSKKELGKIITPSDETTVLPEVTTSKNIEEGKTVKQKSVIKKQTVSKYTALSGEKTKTIKIYEGVLDLLRLLKVSKPECDINETANELIVEGLKKRGWLKDLEQLQSSIKNPVKHENNSVE